jgi:hypothetical protein
MKELAQNLELNPFTGAGTPTVPPINIQGPLTGISTISDLINRLLLFLLPLAGIILFFVLVAGGFSILTSQGSPDKIKNGRAMITAGLIGFFILVFSIGIVKLIGFLLNINQHSPI